MATRRKYKTPAFKDGGAVILDKVVAALPIEASPAAPPLPDDGNPLARAHAAQMRAEAIQRNAPSNAGRPPKIDEHIDAMPISEHKKAFLREHPNLLEPATARQLAFHYQAALNQGIIDDTPGMNEAILSGLKRERERAVDVARSIVEPPAPRKPSMPMSAPVSRETPSYSSGKPVSSNKMTLSPEEVQIARASIVDRPDMPKMTNAQKEYLYLQQRNRYQQMKADGSYSEQRGGNPTFRAGYSDRS